MERGSEALTFVFNGSSRPVLSRRNNRRSASSFSILNCISQITSCIVCMHTKIVRAGKKKQRKRINSEKSKQSTNVWHDSNDDARDVFECEKLSQIWDKQMRVSIYLGVDMATPICLGSANVSQVHRDWFVPSLVHHDSLASLVFAWERRKASQTTKTTVRRRGGGRVAESKAKQCPVR